MVNKDYIVYAIFPSCSMVILDVSLCRGLCNSLRFGAHVKP
jgi:hypothetical protein